MASYYGHRVPLTKRIPNTAALCYAKGSGFIQGHAAANTSRVQQLACRILHNRSNDAGHLPHIVNFIFFHKAVGVQSLTPHVGADTGSVLVAAETRGT